MKCDQKGNAVVDKALLALMHIGAMLLKAGKIANKNSPSYKMMAADAEGLSIAIEILKEIQGPHTVN